MRKISTFSSKISSLTKVDSTVSHKADSPELTDIQRERIEFSTPALIKQQILEMKRKPNQRFMRLIKSCKSTARNLKSIGDIDILKRILIKELTYMLGEYTDLLSNNPSMQLNTYFRVNSVLPDISKETKELSRVMIRCNRIRNSTGVIPPKNQRELTTTMNNWMDAVKDAILGNSNDLVVNGVSDTLDDFGGDDDI